MGEEEVQLVNGCTYFGLVVGDEMSLDAMMEGRRKNAERASGKLHRFLKNQAIQVASKTAIITSVVMSTLMYGAEMWCRRAQTTVNRVLRLVIGF